ncbi:MAG: multicopper oxidase domain-containing protein, partial [Vicinamibacterales bacterium]
MNSSRRNFLRGLAVAAGTTGAARTVSAQHQHQPVQPPPRDPTPERPVRRSTGASMPEFAPGVVGVQTPDVTKMPWQWESGVKIFRLRTEHVRTQFLPGRIADVWGFNGSMPGPTIEVQEGDRVRFIVENGLPEPFSMHWHGLEVPINMDGAP